MESTPSSNSQPHSWSQDSTRPYAFIVAVAALMLLGFLLRLFHLDHQALWLDEAASYHAVAIIPPGCCENGWVYFWILREWVGVAGASEWALRFPSAVFGTLSLLAIMLLGTEVFGKRVGLWSGLFAALNPMHIYYSQEARTYTLLVLVLALAYLILWRALQTNLWRYWIFYALCCLLAVSSHYFAVFALLATGLLPILCPGATGRPRALAMYSIAALPAALLFVFCFNRAAEESAAILPWVELTWQLTPPELAVPKSLELLTLGSQSGLTPIRLKQFDAIAFPAWLRLAGLAVSAGLAVVAMAPWADPALPVSGTGRRKAWLAIVLFLPLAVLWALSFIKPIYVAGRYDMIAFPAVPIMLGLGMAKVQSVVRAGAFATLGLAVLLCGVLATKLFFYYEAASPRIDQTRAALLLEHVRSGDVVVFAGFTAIRTIYYLTRLGYEWDLENCTNDRARMRFACRMFPPGLEQSPAKAALVETLQTAAEAERTVPVFLRRLQSPDHTLWLVPDGFRMEKGLFRRAVIGKLTKFFIDELEERGYDGRFVIENDQVALIRFRNPSGSATPR